MKRPQYTPKRRQGCDIAVWLTPAEARRYRYQALRMGVSLEAFINRAVEFAIVRMRTHPEEFGLTAAEVEQIRQRAAKA